MSRYSRFMEPNQSATDLQRANSTSGSLYRSQRTNPEGLAHQQNRLTLDDLQQLEPYPEAQQTANSRQHVSGSKGKHKAAELQWIAKAKTAKSLMGDGMDCDLRDASTRSQTPQYQSPRGSGRNSPKSEANVLALQSRRRSVPSRAVSIRDSEMMEDVRSEPESTALEVQSYSRASSANTRVKDVVMQTHLPGEVHSKGVVETLVERLDLSKLPEVLDAYRRFLISTIISLTLGYILFTVYLTIKIDLNEQYESEMIRHQEQRDRCADQYFRNRCEPDQRVEALQAYCEERESCMNTPLQAGVKTMSAASGLLAEVLNAFSEKLTLMSFGVVALVLGAIVLCIKAKASAPQPPPSHVTLDLTVPVAHPSTSASPNPIKASKQAPYRRSFDLSIPVQEKN